MPIGNFNYANITRIVFGKGQIASLNTLIPSGKTVFLTYGGGSIKRNGVYDQCMKALKNYKVVEFGGIEANPDFDTLTKAVDQIKKIGAHNVFALAVGGGSVVDGTKFIAAASVYEHSKDLWNILETQGSFVTSALPFGCVLTLAATGSESNGNAVISWRAKNIKTNFGSSHTYPQFAILDPETMYSLPVGQTANGVVDAIVHVCEQYITYPVGAELQDRYCESLLKTLFNNGRKVMEDPKNYEARANIMWCATQALNKWIAQGVPEDWATHRIGYNLTTYLGLDHAKTLAVLQPRVYEYCFEQKKEKLAQMAERVLDITEGTTEEKARKAMNYLEHYYSDVMHLPSRIRDYNCSQDQSWIPQAIEKYRQSKSAFGEHKNITADVIEKLYRDSY
ncbi:hypothetical protein WA158_004686 [Blastocystis sp. Blastoise]